MSDNSVFESLSAGLTAQERAQILISMRTQLEESLAPVIEWEESPPAAVQDQINALKFWGRLRLLVLQIVTGATREDLIIGWTLAGIRRNVARAAAPGLDIQKQTFTEPFVIALEKLFSAVDASGPALEQVAAKRPELVFRLAAQEIPRINGKLLQNTSPEELEKRDEHNERVLKSTLTRDLEERLGEVPQEKAARIRRTLAQIDQLVRIAQLPYATMISSFSGETDAGGRYCAFDYLSHSLERLATDLAPLSEPLEKAALEMVVLTGLREEGFESHQDYEDALKTGFVAPKELLRALRDFSAAYPLIALVRIIRKDPWWKPVLPDRSGNDWLSIYRGKLEERINREVLRVSLQRRAAEQITRLAALISVPPTPFEGFPDGTEGVSLAHYHTALIIWSFTRFYQRETTTTLRLILNGAEFYKSSNRAQYNDAFNEYEQIPTELQRLHDLVSPTGDWGTVLHGDPSRERQIAMAVRVDEEIMRIASQAAVTLEMLTNLLGGILYSRPGSSYDSIANYGQIGGRRNAEMIDEIRQVHAGLQQIHAVISEMRALEKRARENGMFLRASS